MMDLHARERFRTFIGGVESSATDNADTIRIAQQGRDAWTYIHTSDDDPETTLQRFEAMIPNYGCDCPHNYQRIKEQNPPDLSSRDALWAWGVMLHNLVNEKLAAAGDRTKRVLSIAEARAIWNRPEPIAA